MKYISENIAYFVYLCSVTNTVKRAFLIWLSIVMFGNPVTFLSGLGTVIVIIGVTLYNKAQEYDTMYKLAKVNLVRMNEGLS